MQSAAASEALSKVRNDDPDHYVPLETLANLSAALRRAKSPRVAGRHLNAAIEAAGLAAELARESAYLRGEAIQLAELEQALQDAAARAKQSNPSGARPAYGPAVYEMAQEKVEDLIRGYARGLRQSGGASLFEGALAALEAEAIGLAGDLATAVDEERN
jgi:hypothetical protein